MPLVIVNHAPDYPEARLRELAATLPVIVAHALHLTDDEGGQLEPGDVEVRFRPYGDVDVRGELQCVVDVEAIGFPGRVENARERAEMIRDQLSRLGMTNFGVWLTLPPGGWSVG